MYTRFCITALERIQNAPITSVVVTDSIALSEDANIPQITQLTVAPLLAEAIKRIHHDQSISSIFANFDGTPE